MLNQIKAQNKINQVIHETIQKFWKTFIPINLITLAIKNLLNNLKQVIIIIIGLKAKNKRVYLKRDLIL